MTDEQPIERDPEDAETSERPECPRLSDEEIETLARRVITNEIFVGMAGFPTMKSFDALMTMFGGSIPRNAACCWEALSAAGSHGIYDAETGQTFPMFLSVGGWIHVEDTPAFIDSVREKMRAIGIEPG